MGIFFLPRGTVKEEQTSAAVDSPFLFRYSEGLVNAKWFRILCNRISI